MTKLDVGVATRPIAGQRECGDCGGAWVSGCRTVVALADGLGHGPSAAAASSAFVAYVAEHFEEELEGLVRMAGKAIAGTRGAAVAIVRIDCESQRLWFAGVGNIELHSLSRERIAPVSVPGILGRPLRKVKIFEYGLATGDIIILHSDGVSRGVDLPELRGMSAQRASLRVIDTWGKQHDDASCATIVCAG
jgi:phosphoserine phosphatase RsbX